MGTGKRVATETGYKSEFSDKTDNLETNLTYKSNQLALAYSDMLVLFPREISVLGLVIEGH